VGDGMLNRRVWTQQPQVAVGVDWSNPLTNGLILLYNPATNYEAASSVVGSLVTAPLFGIGSAGRYSASNGAGYVALNNTKFPSNAGRSFFSVFSVGASAFNASRIAEGNSTNFQTYEVYRSGSNLLSNLNNVTQVTLGTITPIMTLSGVLGGSVSSFILNGKTRVTSNWTAPSWSSPHHLYVNAAMSGSVSSAGGFQYLVALWSRSLSNAECLALNANPWQLFDPLNRPVFAPSVAAAGGWLGAWGSRPTRNIGTGVK
jgi:hypothetical protein